MATQTDGGASAARYEPPAMTVIGSVEAVTLSSKNGSFSDFKGRSDKSV